MFYVNRFVSRSILPWPLAIIALLALMTLSSPAAKAAAPNILVILSDDYGWGSVGCYGADPKLVRTPNLDRSGQ